MPVLALQVDFAWSDEALNLIRVAMRHVASGITRAPVVFCQHLYAAGHGFESVDAIPAYLQTAAGF